MCGIAGVLELRADWKADPQLVRRMCRAMVHRGPDDEGIYIEGRIGLGMRRLAIIDLENGRQPISNEDETLFIVFNGEIYNHGQLRRELTKAGHCFASQCDTEVIVHLYEEFGHDCVQRLLGMFAFAIWDSRNETLFVARDRLGIKPLYYSASPERFLFGSEIKVLLADSRLQPQFHRGSLPEYLAFGYLSGADTFYSGINKLMPGHWLEINNRGETRTARYWDLTSVQSRQEQDLQYYVKAYRERLEHAVEGHLMSDVPLGVFLSGGLDSSAVAVLMAQACSEPIQTFSVGYSEQTYSELPHARAVAQHLNSVHHEVLLSDDDFFSALPGLIWQEDEPIAWPSSVALYFVARLASEYVKVVLTGEGSDETLAGYARYAFTLKNAAYDRIYREIVPDSLRRKICSAIEQSDWIDSDLRRKLSHTFLGKDGNSWASFYFDNFFSAFGAHRQAEFLDDKLVREFEPGTSYRNVMQYWEESSGSMLQRLLYTDIKTYLVELLMKQDAMSMAVSIESRVPFLDHELVEFAATIPQSFQINGMHGKQILKKSMEDLLPPSILRRKKMGFPTPWTGWMKGPRLENVCQLLLEPRSLQRDLFKRAAVEKLFHEHRSRSHDHSDRIWRLLNLELWHRVCLEGMHTAQSEPACGFHFAS